MATSTAEAPAPPEPSRPSDRAALPLPALFALAAVYVIWGSTYLAIRYVVASMPALMSGGARFMTAGAILLALARSRGEAMPRPRDLAVAVVPGTLLFLVGNGFVAVAERGLPSSLAAVVCATMPLFATGIGQLLGERASLQEWIGLLLGVTGVVLLAAADLQTVPLAGVLLVLAPIGWAVGSLMARRRGTLGGIVATATPMIAGGFTTFVAGALVGERWTSPIDARAWIAWAYLVVFGSLVAFSAYTYLLRTTPPAVATSYAFVNPVLAVLLGVVVGHEKLTPSAGVAFAFVAAGILLVLRARRTKTQVSPSPEAAARRYSAR